MIELPLVIRGNAFAEPNYNVEIDDTKLKAIYAGFQRLCLVPKASSSLEEDYRNLRNKLARTEKNMEIVIDERNTQYDKVTILSKEVEDVMRERDCVKVERDNLAKTCVTYEESERTLECARKMLTPQFALGVLTDALIADPEYAWSWHCNLAMMAKDAGAPHGKANEQAAVLMTRLFKVDTSKSKYYGS